MLELLLQGDQQLFSLINGSWSNSFFDSVLPWIRDKYHWIPLYILVVAAIIYKHRLKSWIFILGAVLTILVSDGVSSKIIKPTVERPRPCHEASGLDNVTLRVGCGSGYSFTSSHATNHFAIAAYLIFIPLILSLGLRMIFLVWAGSICYAQVYVGVHYPLDVFVGGILGYFIGLGMAILANVLFNKMKVSIA